MRKPKNRDKTFRGRHPKVVHANASRLAGPGGYRPAHPTPGDLRGQDLPCGNADHALSTELGPGTNSLTHIPLRESISLTWGFTTLRHRGTHIDRPLFPFPA